MYITNFKLSMEMSPEIYFKRRANTESVDLERRFMELQTLAKRFKQFKSSEGELSKGRVKSLLKLPPAVGGEFTPNSDEQVTCSSDETNTLLVLVQSPYKDITKRMLLRDSWRKQVQRMKQNHPLNWKLVFVVSQPEPSWQEIQLFQTEMRFKRDMLVVQRAEQPSEEAIKLYSAFRWTLNSCSFKFLLLTDTNLLIDIASMYQFIHSENVDLSNNQIFGHKLSGRQNITYNSMDQSKPQTKKLETLQYLVFLVQRDVLMKMMQSMRWLSSFGKVKDSLKMVALAMDTVNVKSKLYEQFISDATEDCQIGYKKSLLIRMANEKCYKKLLLE